MKLYTGDLTVIFLTVNKVPKGWQEYHKGVLLKAIEGFPLITVSVEPMTEMPGINILQTEPFNSSRIYWQMLQAAKMATTPYVAIAEDDVLYCREHFVAFRPPMDTFAYNMTRWSLFTFDEPTYSYKQRIGNFSLIAPRELMIEALEERFAKYPNGTPLDKTGELGKPRTDKLLGLTPRKIVEFYTTIAIIQLSHDFGTELIQQTHRKRRGMLRAISIPHWGDAETLRSHFK
jgi:hypothetical protein